MEIVYHISEDKTKIVAIPVVKSKYAEGINEPIADALIAMGRISESNVSIDTTKIVGIAKLYPGDEYSKKIGQDLAKERLLIKYNKELAKVHKRYSEELKKLQETSERRYISSTNKIKRASERLENIEIYVEKQNNT